MFSFFILEIIVQLTWYKEPAGAGPVVPLQIHIGTYLIIALFRVDFSCRVSQTLHFYMWLSHPTFSPTSEGGMSKWGGSGRV